MKPKKVENNNTFGEKRKCRICGTPVSIYNPRNECFCHDYPKDYRPVYQQSAAGCSWNGRSNYIVDPRFSG